MDGRCLNLEAGVSHADVHAALYDASFITGSCRLDLLNESGIVTKRLLPATCTYYKGEMTSRVEAWSRSLLAICRSFSTRSYCGLHSCGYTHRARFKLAASRLSAVRLRLLQEAMRSAAWNVMLSSVAEVIVSLTMEATEALCLHHAATRSAADVAAVCAGGPDSTATASESGLVESLRAMCFETPSVPHFPLYDERLARDLKAQ